MKRSSNTCTDVQLTKIESSVYSPKRYRKSVIVDVIRRVQMVKDGLIEATVRGARIDHFCPLLLIIDGYRRGGTVRCCARGRALPFGRSENPHEWTFPDQTVWDTWRTCFSTMIPNLTGNGQFSTKLQYPKVALSTRGNPSL